MSESRVRQISKSLREKVGCPELTAKSLRFWRIFDLKKKGVDTLAIARFLGKNSQVQCDESWETVEKNNYRSQVLKSNPMIGFESIFLRDSLFTHVDSAEKV